MLYYSGLSRTLRQLRWVLYHIGIVQLARPLGAYSALARHCTASSLTMRTAARACY